MLPVTQPSVGATPTTTTRSRPSRTEIACRQADL